MILIHGEKLYGTGRIRSIDFPTLAEYKYGKLSKPLKTPTEMFGIVVLQTQYFAARNSSGNILTNTLLSKLYFSYPQILMYY